MRCGASGRDRPTIIDSTLSLAQNAIFWRCSDQHPENSQKPL